MSSPRGTIKATLVIDGDGSDVYTTIELVILQLEKIGWCHVGYNDILKSSHGDGKTRCPILVKEIK